MTRTAAHKAYRQLVRTGHASLVPGLQGGIDAQVEHLTEIAKYINSSDPTEIAAAFLLECNGHDRAQYSLFR